MYSDKKHVLEELEKSHGVISTACQNSGISRGTFYNWKESDEEFRIAVEEINENAIDYVEGKLFSLIDGKDTASTIFFLKTRGKKRGYIERTELSGPDGDPITLAFEKAPSFLANIETKGNGQRTLLTKAGGIPQ